MIYQTKKIFFPDCVVTCTTTKLSTRPYAGHGLDIADVVGGQCAVKNRTDRSIRDKTPKLGFLNTLCKSSFMSKCCQYILTEFCWYGTSAILPY